MQIKIPKDWAMNKAKLEDGQNIEAGASAPCQIPLTPEQVEILDHTEHRAAGGYYCGGGKDMDQLVSLGLMEYAGRKSFVPDPYYRITPSGRQALRTAIARPKTT